MKRSSNAQPLACLQSIPAPSACGKPRKNVWLNLKLFAVLPLALSTIAVCQAPAQAPDAAARHLLHGELLAEEGSRAEALRELALSLRSQPADSATTRTAADLLFQLLIEQRANTRIAFFGHTGPVLYAAFSPDGSRLVTTSEDHTARIWDTRTGQQLGPSLEHDDSVLMAAFSPDGKRIVTASEDHTARVWDVATGHAIGVPMQHIDDVRSARFSPDGKRIATGSADGRARLWDAASGKPLTNPVVYHSTVFSVRFSADGKQLLVASADGVAELLDATTGQRLLHPMRQNNSVFTAVFSSDGNRILTSSADRTARLWDAHTALPTGPVFNHGYWIFSAAFDDASQRVVTASWDHTARVWDARTGAPITPPLQHADAVYSAAFSPGKGIRVATASRDHTARVWDAGTGEPVTLPLQADDEVTEAIFTPDAASLLVAAKDSSVRLYAMPPEGSAPAWLADLADFAASQVRYQQANPATDAGIQKLRTQLLAEPESTQGEPQNARTWERFGRWYFQASDARAVSPWSTLSLQSYVELLTRHDDHASLAYAAALAYDHPTWMQQIIPKLNAHPGSKPDQDR